MEKNKFFSLLYDFNYGSKNELMRCVNLEWEGFDQKLLRTSRVNLSNSWPEKFNISFLSTKGLDYFPCSNELDIVTDPVKEVIEAISKDEVEFLPIISATYSDNILKTYWAIHIKSIINGLNWEKTKWISNFPPERDDPNAALEIIKPCLNIKMVKEKTIFRLEIDGKVDPQIYISCELKNKLSIAGCTKGMDFSTIYVE